MKEYTRMKMCTHMNTLAGQHFTPLPQSAQLSVHNWFCFPLASDYSMGERWPTKQPASFSRVYDHVVKFTVSYIIFNKPCRCTCLIELIENCLFS